MLLVDAEGIEPSPRRADYRFTVCGDLSQYSPRIHVQEPPKARSPDCFRWSGLPCGCLNLSIVEVVLSPSRTLPAIALPSVTKRQGVCWAGNEQLRLGCRTNGCNMAWRQKSPGHLLHRYRSVRHRYTILKNSGCGRRNRTFVTAGYEPASPTSRLPAAMNALYRARSTCTRGKLTFNVKSLRLPLYFYDRRKTGYTSHIHLYPFCQVKTAPRAAAAPKTKVPKPAKAKKPAVQIRKVDFHVRDMMARRGIKTITELSKRLAAIGIKIANPNLGKLVDGKSTYWSQETLVGLMTVLDCELSDLVR